MAARGQTQNAPDLRRLEADVERLRKALTYYAEGRYWDEGEIAREALGEP